MFSIDFLCSYVFYFPHFFAPVVPLYAKSLKLVRSKVSTGDSAVLGAVPGMSLGWSNCCKLAMKGSSNVLDVFIGKRAFCSDSMCFHDILYLDSFMIIYNYYIFILITVHSLFT